MRWSSMISSSLPTFMRDQRPAEAYCFPLTVATLRMSVRICGVDAFRIRLEFFLPSSFAMYQSFKLLKKHAAGVANYGEAMKRWYKLRRVFSIRTLILGNLAFGVVHLFPVLL